MNRLERFDTWNPFEDFGVLRHRLNRAVARFNDPPEQFLTSTGWTPVADVFETKDAIIVKAELPGMSEKDITVQIENGVLTRRASGGWRT
jgi:HSP20 family protein